MVAMYRWGWVNDDEQEINAIAEFGDIVINIPKKNSNQFDVRMTTQISIVEVIPGGSGEFSLQLGGVCVLAGNQRTNLNQIVIFHDDTDDDEILKP